MIPSPRTMGVLRNLRRSSKTIYTRGSIALFTLASEKSYLEATVCTKDDQLNSIAAQNGLLEASLRT